MSDKPITSSHPNLREVSLVPPPLLQTSGRAQRAPRHPQLGEQASGEENTPLPLSFLLFSNKKTSNQALKKKKNQTPQQSIANSQPQQAAGAHAPALSYRAPCGLHEFVGGEGEGLVAQVSVEHFLEDGTAVGKQQRGRGERRYLANPLLMAITQPCSPIPAGRPSPSKRDLTWGIPLRERGEDQGTWGWVSGCLLGVTVLPPLT